MTLRRVVSLARVAVMILALLATCLGPAAAAPSRPSTGRPHAGAPVVFLDQNDAESMHPRRVFLTADAGPYLRRLSWRHWGSARTVAHGQYVSECASCGVHRRTPATVRLSHRRYCRSLDVFYYAKALLFRTPLEGQDNPARISAGSCPPGEASSR